jgi:hypothetical protein
MGETDRFETASAEREATCNACPHHTTCPCAFDVTVACPDAKFEDEEAGVDY